MLHKIVSEKIREVEKLKETLAGEKMDEAIRTLMPTLPFADSLLKSQRRVSVIAEVKKASPSKGVIRPNFDPLSIASEYSRAGVEAISVLTDEKFFQGNKGYLTSIKQEISDIPLLRKDFIIDPLQVYEARLIGADCILLIAAILEPKKMTELAVLAKELGLETLIEVHNQKELEQVLEHTQPTIIGINNRNLETFETSLSTTEELLPFVPNHLPIVSESGIHSKEDIDYLAQMGVRAVLVGEHFMRQQDVSLAVKELVGA